MQIITLALAPAPLPLLSPRELGETPGLSKHVPEQEEDTRGRNAGDDVLIPPPPRANSSDELVDARDLIRDSPHARIDVANRSAVLEEGLARRLRRCRDLVNHAVARINVVPVGQQGFRRARARGLVAVNVSADTAQQIGFRERRLDVALDPGIVAPVVVEI